MTQDQGHQNDACDRCEGCGQLADTDEREPWTAWTTPPPGSNLAIVLGTVKPIPCDECDGTGQKPKPNTQLSEYGKLLRARFELAAQHSEHVLPPAFHKRFHGDMTEWLERDWNYFGAVDSLVVNSQIPFVIDVLRAADDAGLLSEDEKKLVPERAAVSS